jgi:indolepyruvate ferredoxin oxidoreductase beta subunit
MGSDPIALPATKERTVDEGLTPILIPFPPEAHAVIAEGIRRLTDYQGEPYAQRYLERVRRFVGRPGADGAFIREFARHLAVRMTVEDVIRVAQLKLREARLERVTQEARAGDGDIVDVTEYLKPGPEEIFGLLPPRVGRWALARVRHDRAWPLKVTTTRLSGFLRLKVLAALKRWRPRTLRFAEEEAWMERWLGLVDRTLAVNPAAAHEVVASAALVRGYADTYKRGLANWCRIMDGVVEPMLAGRLPRAHFADAVLQARLAASKDPEGQALEQTIAAIHRAPQPGQAAAE